VRCYGEHVVAEHIGKLKNIVGTCWELNGNIVGTRKKWEKYISPPKT
jgi:hypothetical protein